MVATEHILPGNPEIRVSLRQSARARRISLRVSRLDGRVTLTMPRGVPVGEALAFAQSKQDWLRQQLAARPEPVAIGLGAELPVQGELRTVTRAEGRVGHIAEGALYVPENHRAVPRLVEEVLKREARTRLTDAAMRYSASLGRPYGRLSLRDTRSRWGSCSSEGNLMFSWRLIMAPREVLEYVAAHEVAHLAQMNHSPAFWAVVDRLYGPHAAERRWLRQHGEKLHRYRFDTAQNGD
ncbi:SprT family zinc-dependent metalloprotease [Cognatishimia sp. SS12]|uniref:M48 family metallopeptidase n=1 Tax=Cognatishimia sp. SS12 TaxID=2979465 RepID=UPI00232DE340|nr:SprT family zinc-dependent metalloprotease [Cognatishimia sp. SS12]MDC0739193.1 SprT family zinc-dependent metalloprotease [Cognatishimia sp. SS12]